MRRVLLPCVIAALAFGIGLYLLPPKQYEWHSIRSSQGRFQVTLPGKPAFTDSQTTDAVDGTQFISHNVSSSPRKDVVFAVGWWENPSQTGKSDSELFDHLRECGKRAFHGAITDEVSIQVGPYTAKDFRISGDRFDIVNRVTRAGTRVYSVWVIQPKGKWDATAERRFLDSFGIDTL